MSSRTIIGNSPVVKDMLKVIGQVARSKTNILVLGESGTGKELVARLIHESSPIKDGPFVPVNCGAIPETLIESEMFGHRKGSFTGAVAEKVGLFQVANGGTLFLDEVGELPLGMQVKLLRAIQERSFRKVGGTEDVHVDVRIIAATNRDLEAAIAKGTFREDLYYRLNVIQIRTPPLRERDGDVKILAEYFLKKASAKQGKTFEGFDDEAMEALTTYSWPGNVRELENVLERSVTLESGKVLSVDTLPDTLRASWAAVSAQKSASGSARAGGGKATGSQGAAPPLPPADFTQGPLKLDEILAAVEKVYVSAALEAAAGDQRKAADLLGVTFRSIRYRMGKLGMGPAEDSEA